MKLLLVIYSGPDSRLVPELLDRHKAGGYTELGPVHGAGSSGRIAGSRAWPGDAALYFSIVPATQLDALLAALHDRVASLQPGEHLHAAVLPTDSFF